MAGSIPLFEIDWGVDEITNAVESIGRGGYWAKGPFVERFEDGLESYFGVDHAVVVNSGTTALVTALRGCGVGPRDEVIVPSFTFIATANAVRLVGADPVFADVETETYGLDPDAVRDRVTERTAAILPVHVYGQPCRIDDLASIADEADAVLVEDAAEAFGATHGGEYVGTVGDVGVLSFCQNKVVTTGEGGAVLTDDEEVAAECRLYRSHGRPEGDYFDSVDSGEYVALGTNVRMSDLTAAIGCAQLDRAETLIDARQRAANHLTDALADVDGVSTPSVAGERTHVYQIYTVEFEPWVDRAAVVETLAARDVAAKVYWDPPVHRTQYYRETLAEPRGDLSRTTDLAGRVLSLPMYPGITPGQLDRVAAAVREGVERSR